VPKATIEKRIHRAIQARDSIHSSSNALRLIDGDGDALPGIFLEEFADHWLLSTSHSSVDPNIKAALSDFGKSLYWKRLDQHEKESPIHLSGPLCEKPFFIRENKIAYEISFQSGYSQGIFLDQRDNRLRVRKRAQNGHRILNTFSYTGAFSVSAAMGGATTTTLDLSQPYLDWAKRNFEANQLDPSKHYFCKGDTFHWLKRFAKSGRTFHGIILDPPTFSRDAKGDVFRAEKDYDKLVKLAAACLEAEGWLLCSTNCRKITPSSFKNIVLHGLGNDQTNSKIETLKMPTDFNGHQYLQALWATI